jgi:tRNA pseudouridine synthase 10
VTTARRGRKRRRGGGCAKGAGSAAATAPAVSEIEARLRKIGRSATDAARALGAGGCFASPPLRVAVPKCQNAAPRLCGTTPCSARVEARRAPLYLMGRYIKRARGVSQSPWFIEGVRRAETSVQELTQASVLSHFGAPEAECRFHSAGREDVDVRMLGAGRPFVIEARDAKRARCSIEDCARMQEVTNASAAASAVHACLTSAGGSGGDAPDATRYNGAVRVEGLRPSSLAAFDRLKAGAEKKRKRYCAVVWTSRPVSKQALAERLESLTDLKVMQSTPMRVLHRRTAMVREKFVHSMRCERINRRWFLLRLEASAGTYIKEFVHGDLGRTVPSVGSLLGCRTDIVQLDVEDVIMDL